ncbi:MAG: hypothetical protein MUO90_01185 [Dehalococcoidales bacterium]|nr:hypothetical protein [Dehalococcoidales bacterium]
MRIPPIAKAILLLIVIIAVWVGGAILINNQINTPAQTSTTTSQTTTATTTPTPTPTPTTTSNLSPEEQAYITTITDHSSRVTAAVISLSELLGDPQIDNDTWVSQATVQAETLRSLYDEMVQVPTPYSTFNIHYNYTYALSVYKSAAEAIDQGIADQEISSIQQFVSLMNSGTNLLNNSINMLNEFIVGRS